MKKFIILLSLSLVAFFFHFNSMAKEENIVYSIVNYENSNVFINQNDSQINLSHFACYYISNYYDYEFYLFDVLFLLQNVLEFWKSRVISCVLRAVVFSLCEAKWDLNINSKDKDCLRHSTNSEFSEKLIASASLNKKLKSSFSNGI